MEDQTFIAGAPLAPLATTTAPTDLPRTMAIQGMALQETRDCVHEAWAMGSTEGRAMAEVFFGPAVVAALPKDRFGAPAGYLHAWSLYHKAVRWHAEAELLWVMIAGQRKCGPMAALHAEWRPGKGLEELLARGRSVLPLAFKDWKMALAEELRLPTILEHWNAR